MLSLCFTFQTAVLQGVGLHESGEELNQEVAGLPCQEKLVPGAKESGGLQ